MNHVVTTNGFKVIIEHPETEEKPLEMDFEPICRRFLVEDGVLVHWQAKPFGLRRWGAFDVERQRYYSLEYNQLQISGISHRTLQLSEKRNPGIKPTAVLWYPGAYIATPNERHNYYRLLK